MKKVLSVLAILAVLMTSAMSAYAAQPADETASTYTAGADKFTFSVNSSTLYDCSPYQDMEADVNPYVTLFYDVPSRTQFVVCFQDDPMYQDPANDSQITNVVGMNVHTTEFFTYQSVWTSRRNSEDKYYLRVSTLTAGATSSSEVEWDI